MNADNLWSVVFLGAVLMIIALRLVARKKPSLFVPDYQRAVKFVDGAFKNVLDPGSYGPPGKNEQITVVDLRPQPIVVERVMFQDAIQASSVISIGAELMISDPADAVTKLKNLLNDSIAIIRDQLRSTMSKRIADWDPATRAKLASDITLSLNSDLRKFGVQLQNVEITELWSRTIKPTATMGAN